ncbi:putative histone-like DNA-binding protein [Parabacteroides sp. PFB2-12]|uniref:HU family DNA-binding protein n=1 Tax=unclassified Parabacteroides TaxID=2649774 RepID=UPI002476A554|nr:MULTISPECIES: HU family DNA-binding protein [unclassified Parabacteroides]MDH6342951.1 putative histone-like DNA-binding protein [Parabacteroides sp. PM6-13]MDH6391034.1 putative histone-like DNA-binding protein [Parabacteroides sp. PFB2-12]
MARYKLVRNPNLGEEGKEMPYHARYVAYGTVGLDEMIEKMSDRTSFSSADIKGMAQLFQDMIVEELRFGNNVEIDGIGIFTASLQCPPVMNKKEIRAESISFRTVKFRPSIKLCKRLKSLPLYKAPEEKEKQSFTREERRLRVLDYLTQKERITGSEYMRLNHCSRACASRDLIDFREEGLVKRQGRGPTLYYVKMQ